MNHSALQLKNIPTWCRIWNYQNNYVKKIVIILKISESIIWSVISQTGNEDG